MRKFFTLSAISAAALAASSSASATVVYDFNWDSTISFSLTVDDFLTGSGSFSPADLDSCTHIAGPCTGLDYTDNFGGGGVDTFIVHFNPGGSFLNFADGTFAIPGTHSESVGHGTLTITQSVPEPSTWAMMLIGFGAVGFAMRRRRYGELTVRRTA